MRFTKVLLLAGLGSFALTGCNPSDFNTILDKAPVQELSTEGSSTGSLFVLPLPANQTSNVAARMLVSRKDSTYLAVADYDMNGKATLHQAGDLSFGVYSSAVRADGLILLGTPGYPGPPTPAGRVSTLTLGSNPDGSPTFAVQDGILGDGHLGISVAVGNVTGPSTGDFVALSDNSVQLLGTDPTIPIASSADNCQPLQQLGASASGYAFRPLVVADLLTGANDEIVLGGQVDGKGQVLFVQYDVSNVVKGKIELPCPTMAKALSVGASTGFGTSLAAGDFDGDGRADLAVGNPPDRVYVYFGPLDATVAPDVTILGATATQFGKQIAAYSMQGQATAQLMVADPTAQSQGGVGTVMLFNVSRGTPSIQSKDAVATLFDSNTDSDPGLFGLNLGGVQFNTGLCNPGGPVQLVPWASLGPSLFTFFSYSGPGAPADPRCFR